MDRGRDLDRGGKLVREGLELDPEGTMSSFGYVVLADILSRKGRSREALEAVGSGRRLQAGAAPPR